jgi:hypothetical protein
MYEYELAWLRVRPIHQLGYRLLIEGDMGYQGVPLNAPAGAGRGYGSGYRGVPLNAPTDARQGCAVEPDTAQPAPPFAIPAGLPESAAVRNMLALTQQTSARLRIGVHVKAAVEGYRAILREHCTDRKRSKDGKLVQVYPPYFDPGRNRIGEVRQVSSDALLVYVQSDGGVTRRYHLRRVHGDWRIDFAGNEGPRPVYEGCRTVRLCLAVSARRSDHERER